MMETLKKAIREIVEGLGFELYHVGFGTKHGSRVLTVEIDNENGVDIDDCVRVSEKVSDYLDETDPIESSYQLEVASAGAERELRDDEAVQRAVGKYIHVRTFEQTFEGTLLAATQDSVTIKEKNNQTTVVLTADIQLIRLAVEL